MLNVKIHFIRVKKKYISLLQFTVLTTKHRKTEILTVSHKEVKFSNSCGFSMAMFQNVFIETAKILLRHFFFSFSNRDKQLTKYCRLRNFFRIEMQLKALILLRYELYIFAEIYCQLTKSP